MKTTFTAKLLAPVLITCCACPATMASANIIDTTYGIGAGGFELGAFVNNAIFAVPLAPGSTLMTGWTVGGPGDGIDWLLTPIYRPDTGIHAIDLQSRSNSSVSTVIPTVAGTPYQLSFAAATITGQNATGIVSAGTLVNQPFAASFSTSPGTQVFTQFSMVFTATAPSTTITFQALGAPVSSSYGPVLDSVSVTVVPEPGTALLFALGAVALLSRAKSSARTLHPRDA